MLKKLGLQPAPVSNQVVQRDRHAQFVCALAQIGATLEKVAVKADEIKGKFKDGVLALTLPKKDEKKEPDSIEIAIED